MKMKKPPCKGCQDRQIGCHAGCSRYAEWKTQHLETKTMNAERLGDRAAWELLQNGARKSMNRQPKKR